LRKDEWRKDRLKEGGVEGGLKKGGVKREGMRRTRSGRKAREEKATLCGEGAFGGGFGVGLFLRRAFRVRASRGGMCIATKFLGRALQGGR